MSAPVRYGMIVLDAAPTIARVRGTPIIFHSPEETVEYAQLHDVQRWMVYGDPEGGGRCIHRMGRSTRLQSLSRPAKIKLQIM